MPARRSRRSAPDRGRPEPRELSPGGRTTSAGDGHQVAGDERLKRINGCGLPSGGRRYQGFPDVSTTVRPRFERALQEISPYADRVCVCDLQEPGAVVRVVVPGFESPNGPRPETPRAGVRGSPGDKPGEGRGLSHREAAHAYHPPPGPACERTSIYLSGNPAPSGEWGDHGDSRRKAMPRRLQAPRHRGEE
jgi:hypothetical protein